ncbi:penicillin-binding protein 2 [Nocardioides sp. SYSU D00038]|uniref:peptidoglycan D,D-transpeptidase FtsI family protein n=1 Tax=Nocardioides sp. SYSU D00038 TaxID=2812554 RepID=UPI00196785C3|nr:penicillin-binding protein 2 [Nocardioides sp. SYSU D00038]
MNKPIRTISIFCLFLFLALMVNATYLQYWKAEDYNDNALNRRVIEAAYSRERGAILVGREPIAESLPVKDKYKFQRTYPTPFLYAPVTGYFSFFDQTGIERSQNGILSGEDSKLFVTNLVDLLSNEEGKGGNVQLTLDPDAQRAAYDGLDALNGDVEGAVVALEPRTGKILAMASLPTFDPNKLAAHDLGAVGDAYDRLNDAESEPLVNRGIQKTLPPGSTFKLVTAAAAMTYADYSADDDVPGGPTFQLPETSGESGVIDNEGRSCGSGKIPFGQAMAQSCNTTFAQLALEVGADRMRDQAEAFGFNSRYLEDLGPQAVSQFPDEMGRAQTGQTGIGQFDVRATPLQMAMVAAAIGNQGTVMQPYIVDEVQTPDLRTLDKTEPRELSQAVSSSVADGLTQLLVETVREGTAGPAAIPGVEVAGKTGTAQSGIDDVPPYAWFVSFAPAQDPEVAVAVMIESADYERGEIAGGLLGGPIARAVMEAVLQ